MKIRTAYFKVSNMEQAIDFWHKFLGFAPHKRTKTWSEFKCLNINLALLWMKDFKIEKGKSNFVPVFEFTAVERDQKKDLALSLGASLVVDIKEHPDKMSYVLADKFGHEFEVTSFCD